MRKFKNFFFITISLFVIAIMCSANFNFDRLQIISQNIDLASHKKDLAFSANVAFKEGEVLTYRMHYGIINAGIVELEVKPNLVQINGHEVYHIIGNGYTTGTTDWFFKVRDRYETYMDKDALIPWYFVRRVNEGGFKFNQDYVFNHFTKKVDIGNNEKFDVPVGIQDMVSAFYYARNLELSNAKIGNIYSLNCFLDKEIWPLKIKFIGKEIIQTALGKYRCLIFRPIVQKGRIFKKEEDLNVWISDDKNHIVMRAQADILVGSIKMDILQVKNLANATSFIN